MGKYVTLPGPEAFEYLLSRPGVKEKVLEALGLGDDSSTEPQSDSLSSTPPKTAEKTLPDQDSTS